MQAPNDPLTLMCITLSGAAWSNTPSTVQEPNNDVDDDDEGSNKGIWVHRVYSEFMLCRHIDTTICTHIRVNDIAVPVRSLGKIYRTFLNAAHTLHLLLDANTDASGQQFGRCITGWAWSTEEETDFAQALGSKLNQAHCMGAHPLGGTLSRRGRSPIKLAYSPSRPDGWLRLTVSAFNRLGQYTISPGHRAYCYAGLTISSLAMAVTMPVLILPSQGG